MRCQAITSASSSATTVASRSGKIKLGADAAGFFAAQQDVAFQHQFADVLEADGHFVNAAAEARGDLVEQLGGGKCLGHVAGQFARAGQMPEQDGEDLVRRDERAVAIHGADAVAVAVGGKAGVVAARAHRVAQRFDVRLDRLGIDAAEQRIARAANFVAGDAVAGASVRRSSPRAAPCMGSTTKRNFAARIFSQSTSFSTVSR